MINGTRHSVEGVPCFVIVMYAADSLPLEEPLWFYARCKLAQPALHLMSSTHLQSLPVKPAVAAGGAKKKR